MPAVKNIKKTQSNDFAKIALLIGKTKEKVWQKANQLLIELYWNIGKYISNKVAKEEWGKSVVEELSNYLLTNDPSLRGFSARNLWRMKQFYETYIDTKLSTVLTEISWSNHLHILSKTKNEAERTFYLELAGKHHYSARDLARIIDSGTYERTILADKKLSTVLPEFKGLQEGIFKDSYIFEFLDLPETYIAG